MSSAPGEAPPPSAPNAPSRPGSRPPVLLMVAIALLVDAALLTVGVGGPAALAHHPRALALLAIWIVSAPFLVGPRAPAHAPRDEVRADPGVLLALTAIPFLTPFVSALCERFGVWPLPGGMALRWAGVALSAAGFALRIAAMRRL